jgi:hypothetical protein
VTAAQKACRAGWKARTARADAKAADNASTIAELQAAGATSLRTIAAELNRRGIPTATGRMAGCAGCAGAGAASLSMPPPAPPTGPAYPQLGYPAPTKPGRGTALGGLATPPRPVGSDIPQIAAVLAVGLGGRDGSILLQKSENEG